MSYRWKVLESAVESKLYFTDVDCYAEYVGKLKRDNRNFEVLDIQVNEEDGSIEAVVRKEYNNNSFRKSEADNLIDSHYRKHIDRGVDLDYIKQAIEKSTRGDRETDKKIIIKIKGEE